MCCILRPLHGHSYDHATKTRYPVKAVLTLKTLFQKPTLILRFLYLEVHPTWESRILYYSGSIITNHTRYTREIKSRIVVAKAAFNKKIIFTSELDLNLRKKLVKCYICSTALCGTDTWTLRKVGQKYQESSEMWCWRMMYKICWTDRMKNEVLHRAKEDGNILHVIKGSRVLCNGHILCRNCFWNTLLKER